MGYYWLPTRLTLTLGEPGTRREIPRERRAKWYWLHKNGLSWKLQIISLIQQTLWGHSCKRNANTREKSPRRKLSVIYPLKDRQCQGPGIPEVAVEGYTNTPTHTLYLKTFNQTSLPRATSSKAESRAVFSSFFFLLFSIYLCTLYLILFFFSPFLSCFLSSLSKSTEWLSV